MSEKEELEIIERGNTFRSVVFCNSLTLVTGMLCVTYAAIYFNRIAILGFYALVALMPMHKVTHSDNINK